MKIGSSSSVSFLLEQYIQFSNVILMFFLFTFNIILLPVTISWSILLTWIVFYQSGFRPLVQIMSFNEEKLQHLSDLRLLDICKVD